MGLSISWDVFGKAGQTCRAHFYVCKRQKQNQVMHPFQVFLEHVLVGSSHMQEWFSTAFWGVTAAPAAFPAPALWSPGTTRPEAVTRGGLPEKQKLWKDVAQEIKMVLVIELLLVISALSCYLCPCYETRKKTGAGGSMRRTAIKLRLCVCCGVSALFPPHLPLKNPTYLAICVPTARFVPK